MTHTAAFLLLLITPGILTAPAPVADPVRLAANVPNTFSNISIMEGGGVMLDDCNSDTTLEKASEWLAGKIPVIGSFVSAMINIFWPPPSPTCIIDAAVAKMKQIIKDDLDEAYINDLKDYLYTYHTELKDLEHESDLTKRWQAVVEVVHKMEDNQAKFVLTTIPAALTLLPHFMALKLAIMKFLADNEAKYGGGSTYRWEDMYKQDLTYFTKFTLYMMEDMAINVGDGAAIDVANYRNILYNASPFGILIGKWVALNALPAGFSDSATLRSGSLIALRNQKNQYVSGRDREGIDVVQKTCTGGRGPFFSPDPETGCVGEEFHIYADGKRDGDYITSCDMVVMKVQTNRYINCMPLSKTDMTQRCYMSSCGYSANGFNWAERDKCTRQVFKIYVDENRNCGLPISARNMVKFSLWYDETMELVSACYTAGQTGCGHCDTSNYWGIHMVRDGIFQNYGCSLRQQGRNGFTLFVKGNERVNFKDV